MMVIWHAFVNRSWIPWKSLPGNDLEQFLKEIKCEVKDPLGYAAYGSFTAANIYAMVPSSTSPAPSGWCSNANHQNYRLVKCIENVSHVCLIKIKIKKRKAEALFAFRILDQGFWFKYQSNFFTSEIQFKITLSGPDSGGQDMPAISVWMVHICIIYTAFSRGLGLLSVPR